MAEVRILSRVRLDAWVVDDDLVITKNWTTVADDQVEELLRCSYKGSSVFEVSEPPAVVDEAPADIFLDDDIAVETEDESDGTN